MGCVPNPLSSTDFGAEVWVDIIWRMKQRPRKIPPHHQLALVRRFPAWRMPIKASGEELAPPKLAASPVPLPACRRIAAIKTMQSMISSVRRNV